jgi:iron(III) transport system substrate-binding protein
MEALMRCSRRHALLALLCSAVLPIASCDKREQAAGASGAPSQEVVLYSSADTDLVKLVAAEFEKDTGIRVKWVGDTEATKNTGLVQRLRAERDHPRADVWWSSEPFSTINLAKEGTFAAYSSASEAGIEGGWPKAMRDPDGAWYAFASRARVVVYNTERVKPEEAPRTLADLYSPRFKDRVGMARPRFGSTGGQMAAILHVHSEVGLRTFLERLKGNGVRLYDGNASVMRAVANGEIHVGLTDTDDVWAGKRNAYPIDLAYERNDPAADPQASWGPPPATLEVGWGPLVIPNMTAVVRGGPNPENAKRLVDFLISEKVERLLAQSESHNVPVRPSLAADPAFAPYAVPSPMRIDLARVAGGMEQALRICDEVLR